MEFSPSWDFAKFNDCTVNLSKPQMKTEAKVIIYCFR